MERRLAGVLPGVLSAAVIAVGLLLLLHHAPASGRPLAASASVQPASSDSAAGSGFDLAGWCHEYIHPNQTLNASLESKLGGHDDSAESESPYIYVTIIQSKGIPIQGVYANPAAGEHGRPLRVPVINDAFAVC